MMHYTVGEIESMGLSSWLISGAGHREYLAQVEMFDLCPITSS